MVLRGPRGSIDVPTIVVWPFASRVIWPPRRIIQPAFAVRAYSISASRTDELGGISRSTGGPAKPPWTCCTLMKLDGCSIMTAFTSSESSPWKWPPFSSGTSRGVLVSTRRLLRT